MCRYLLSYLMPVKTMNHGKIVVVIRGLKFEAETWLEVIRQIEEKIEFYRKEMSADMRNVTYSLPGGNLHGKWNPNLIVLKNDMKNLQVLEEYLRKHHPRNYSSL